MVVVVVVMIVYGKQKYAIFKKNNSEFLYSFFFSHTKSLNTSSSYLNQSLGSVYNLFLINYYIQYFSIL